MTRSGATTWNRKMRLVDRDGVRCHYCLLGMNFVPMNGILHPRSVTIEHIVPHYIMRVVHPGLSNTLDNLVLACYECNNTRGDEMETHEGCEFCEAAVLKYMPLYEVPKTGGKRARMLQPLLSDDIANQLVRLYG